MKKQINFNKEFDSHKKGVSLAFNKVKEELTEHLDAINQNTNEMSFMHQYIVELENKIEKLSERIDEITLTNDSTNPSKIEYDVEQSLSIREQEVFLALYLADSKKTAVEIAQYLGLTEDLINNYVFKLISKGIPINKIFSKNKSSLFYSLNKHFKDLQARKNVVMINESVMEEMNIHNKV